MGVLATTHAAPAVVPHLGYGLGLGYAYGAPLLHGAVPHTYTVAHKDATVTPGKVEVTAKTAPLVYAAHPYAYGHLGYYGLPLLAAAEEPAAVEARKKREAEAKADPEAWYYGYYGHGYGGYYGLGYGRYYGGYYGYPYAGYGYRHFGKRSADAEPEADAAADAYYGYYGHGYGYGRYYGGYYGYPYARGYGYGRFGYYG